MSFLLAVAASALLQFNLGQAEPAREKVLLRLEGGRSFGSISASPDNRNFLIQSWDPGAGPFSDGCGNWALVTLENDAARLTALPYAISEYSSEPVWATDGQAVFFDSYCGASDDEPVGIYRLDVKTQKVVPILLRETGDSLALSPDGGLLAFWGSGDKLTVLDLTSGRKIKQWKFRHHFDDYVVNGLSFSDDGRFLFALVMGERRGTPLKRIELETGTTVTVAEDATSLVKLSDGVYFLHLVKAVPFTNPGATHHLVRIPGGTLEPEVLRTGFARYTGFLKADSRRLLLLEDGKGPSVYDPRDDSVCFLGRDTHTVALLPEGELLASSGNELKRIPLRCKPQRH